MPRSLEGGNTSWQMFIVSIIFSSGEWASSQGLRPPWTDYKEFIINEIQATNNKSAKRSLFVKIFDSFNCLFYYEEIRVWGHVSRHFSLLSFIRIKSEIIQECISYSATEYLRSEAEKVPYGAECCTSLGTRHQAEVNGWWDKTCQSELISGSQISPRNCKCKVSFSNIFASNLPSFHLSLHRFFSLFMNLFMKIILRMQNPRVRNIRWWHSEKYDNNLVLIILYSMYVNVNVMF